MIFYNLRQNKNKDSKAFNKWFAHPLIKETVDLNDLAEHMSSHNTVFSKGIILGMLTDMVGCIKELLLEGKNVKVADLAIFSLGIKNKGGAATEDEFNVAKHIKSVKLRARATGDLLAKSLNLEATLKNAATITGKSSSTAPKDNNTGNTGGNTGNTGDNTGSNTGNNPTPSDPGNNEDDPEN